ncbi:FKBP12-associated protein [Serendipita sp. 396]|nr:FKBP12-associated protein [Serendipita sp. 396]KAG8802533.1 FKBP12-associated protein [Serendipita sp. 398]KAG8846794.1 FKBP12-associated protein [Serendipita sp. 411]KAG8875765.1 FKBP12-associated protein [Serendipita sp. 405]
MQPKCTSECQIAARNARLAEALGIDRSAQGISERVMAHYAPELQSFARANLPFVRMVEAAFSDFVSSDRSAHTLPHMPELKRNFVYNLAKVYRMDARMVDAEPQRSVELIRRIDTRIANPLLSATVQPGSAPLGKLQTKTSTSTDASPARQAPSSLPPSTALPWSAIASKTISSPARPQLPLAPVAAQRSQGLTYSPARPAPTPLSPTNVRADWEADD